MGSSLDSITFRPFYPSMLIIKENEALGRLMASHRAHQRRIGFAPTMGALHEGHLSLVRRARESCGIVVASVFVNPTQFNDPGDLERYPRPLKHDVALLEEADCDVLYLPTVDSIYPRGTHPSDADLEGPLDHLMEGAFRPGHFTGVRQVVRRLLELVAPDELFMGQKDYQQVAVIREMLRRSGSSLQLTMCPTTRESDGLAMSSRNALLTPEWRQVAPVIHETLQRAFTELGELAARDIELRAMDRLREAGLRPEYFSVADGDTLQPVGDPGGHARIVACTAAWAGNVRLIDNLMLRG